MMQITPNESSVKIYGVAPNTTWHESHTVQRERNSYTVTCTLKNLKVSISLKATTEGVSVETNNTLVIVCIAIICLLILALTISYCWGKRKDKAIKALQPTEQLMSVDIYGFYTGVISTPTTTNNEALLLPYNTDNEIDHDDISLDGSILGSGQFGIVLKGHIGPLCVAVKIVKPSTDIIYLKSLFSELKILQYVGTHRNVVNLIGANTKNIKKHEVLVVLDYCSNGNLASFLKQNRDCFVNLFDGSNSTKTLKSDENATQITLTTRNLILIAGEIACGMDHISSKNVIHGDLAARNVLITEDFHAKICDFGLAKQLLNYSVYVQKIECPLPLRWMALESLQDMKFSLASDKWSYVICLWEIFSLAELPHPGVQWNFETYKMLQEGYRMEKPKFSNDSSYRLMLQCWNSQPLERPSFQFLINELKKRTCFRNLERAVQSI